MSNKPKMAAKPKKSQQEKENIKITNLMSDRLLCEIIEVEPTKHSGILNPATGAPYKPEEFYDRYPARGKIIEIGLKIKEDFPQIKVGDTVFFESPSSGYIMHVNGNKYFQTRISNIMLTYEEL
jgi:co-chaperonin GroES (HSP10)